MQVRKAGSSVYHLACFACDLCQRQLSTGEQFTIDSVESKLLCKLHFGINKEGEYIHEYTRIISSSTSHHRWTPVDATRVPKVSMCVHCKIVTMFFGKHKRCLLSLLSSPSPHALPPLRVFLVPSKPQLLARSPLFSSLSPLDFSTSFFNSSTQTAVFVLFDAESE